MKGTSGQVQTVSIIDTISELANNQGDRAKLTQVAKSSRNQSPGNASRISSRNQSPGRATNLQLQLAPNTRHPPSPPSGPRSHPPPPPLNPRSPKVTVPSNLLATNINIGPQSFKQMSLTSRTSPSSQYNGSNYSVNKLGSIHVNGLVRPNFAEFSSGLGKAPYLNSTLKIDSDQERRKRRMKKPRSNIRVGRGQGETPDWIRELFGFARKGNLDGLKEALSDMEKTLIRNLSDHLGNNLLHIVCRHGHASVLPWLAARLGPELDSALSDENKQGLTPIVLAIKHGRQELVVWLVTNTRERERLQTRDGDRCLLHAAAKYGQDGISGWLSEEMTQEGMDLDQMDVSGNTPLHLAARTGKTKTASALLNLGASVNMKNDMGMKPSDCAIIRGKDSTAEFLLMFETSLGITKDLLQKEKTQEHVVSENGELKSNFKDVLSVSKKLAKEREEMCKELSKLHESMIELHDKMIMEMQVMAQENASLRKNGITKEDKTSDKLESTIEMCDKLHEKWQQHQKQFFSSSLADMEHRIMLAEDSMKKNKQTSSVNDVEPSYAHRSLRDRLEEIKVQSSSLTAGARKLSTTCSSESASTCEESDHDDLATQHSEDANFYEAMKTPTSRHNVAQRKKLATPSPSHRKTKNASDHSVNESVYSSLSSPMYSTIGSPNEKGTPHTPQCDSSRDFDSTDSFIRQGGLDYYRAKATASELARSVGSPYRQSFSKDDRRRSRADLKKRLKQLALTSETGSASVIEVIEPNSSEEEEFKKSMQEMNISWTKSLTSQAEPQTPANRSKRHSMEPLPSPAPSSTPSKTSESSNSLKGSRANSLENAKAPNPIPPTKKLSEMGISANSMHKVNLNALFTSNNNDTKSASKLVESKNLLTSEPDILSGIKGVRQDNRDSLHLEDNEAEDINDDVDLMIDDFGEDFYNEDFTDVQMLPYDLESERSESSLQIKKKGFLQKLSISKWANKKKSSKAASKAKEIAPEYFRETYVTPKGDNIHEITVQEISSSGKSIEPETQGEDAIKSNQKPMALSTACTGERSETIRNGVTTIAVGQTYRDSPRDNTQEIHAGDSNNQIGNQGDPPLDTRLSKSLSPSSRKSLYSHFNKEAEGLSVATSDDSGIIARPLSSASKSETSLSRPDSSTSDPPIRKSFCGSFDQLEQGNYRVSPIGSEQPKLDSGMSPTGSGEFSKLGKIEEGSISESVSQTTIITLHSANLNGLPETNNNAQEGGRVAVRKSSTTRSRSSKTVHIEEKPWYDVSDDDVDIRTPDHITSIISVRGSSDEDTF